MNHTPGTLYFRGPSRPRPDTPEGGDYALIDQDGKIIAEVFARVGYGVEGMRNARENARRMVALWNTFQRLSIEDIEVLLHAQEASHG